MHSFYKTWLIFGALFGLMVAGCRKSESPLKLFDRIVSANTSQYCRVPDACFNPSILADENGYDVTGFPGPEPQNVHVSANDLAKYLQKLPMTAWPRGPSVVITRSDDVFDEPAIERDLEAAVRVCRDMGLEVQVRPAG